MSQDERAPDVISLSDLPPCKRGLSRRNFCAAAGSGLIAIGLGACDGGPARLSTGSLDDNSGGGGGGGGGGGDSTDMAGGGGGGGGGSTDMAHGGGGGGSTDMAHGGGGTSCSGTLNAGAASAIAVGSAKHFTDNQNYDLFVCRDANGLFTVDAQCTHAGCDVKLQSGHWYCNCHGATFAFDGTKPTSPAHSPLANYEVCVDSSGTILVDYNKTVSNTTRV